MYFSLSKTWQTEYLCLANMYKHIRAQENQPSMFYETFTGEITEPSIDTIMSYILQSVTSMTLTLTFLNHCGGIIFAQNGFDCNAN